MKLNFSSRPAHTLLFVGREEIVRVDADKRGMLLGDLHAVDSPCESLSELPSALEAALHNGPRCGRRTWILYHGIATYELTLPSVQTAGVGPEILIEALRFEFEALTGQATANSHLAYSLLGEEDEMSRFWISLIPVESFKRIQAVLHKGRTRLGGITHPGGVPQPLSGENFREWTRMEYWPDTLLALHSSTKAGLSLQLFPHNHRQGNNHEELQRWRQGIGPVEICEALATTALEFAPEVDAYYRLDHHDTLFNWLSAWARELADAEETRVPVLKVPQRGDKELTLTIAIAAAALLACSLHFGWHSFNAARYQSDTEALKSIEKGMKSTLDAIAKSRDRKDQLKKELDALKGDASLLPAVITALHRRPARLLRALAENRSDDIVIEGIATSGDAVVVQGVSLDPTRPNRLTANLEKDLAGLGWRISPPDKRDMGLFPSGGPWAFTLQLRDGGIEGFKESPEIAQTQAKEVS